MLRRNVSSYIYLAMVNAKGPNRRTVKKDITRLWNGITLMELYLG